MTSRQQKQLHKEDNIGRLERKMIDLEAGHLSITQTVTEISERQSHLETRVDQTETELREVKNIALSLQSSFNSLDDSVTATLVEMKKTPVWLRQVQYLLAGIILLWLIAAYIVK